MLPLVLVLERVGIESPYLQGFINAFLTAAIPEEAAKLAVLALYAGRHSAFDEPMDGIVYGVAASLGLATLLHGLYDAPLLTMGQLTAGGARVESGPALGLVCAGLFFLGIVVVWAIVALRRSRREQRARPAPAAVMVMVAAPARRGSPVLGWIALLFGGLAASWGGLVTLGVGAALLQGTAADDGVALVVGWAIIGLVPLLIGLGVFALGIRFLNGSAAPALARV